MLLGKVVKLECSWEQVLLPGVVLLLLHLSFELVTLPVATTAKDMITIKTEDNVHAIEPNIDFVKLNKCRFVLNS